MQNDNGDSGDDRFEDIELFKDDLQTLLNLVRWKFENIQLQSDFEIVRLFVHTLTLGKPMQDNSNYS